MVPPSIHESGRAYAWIDESIEVAELPQALGGSLGKGAKEQARDEP